MPSLNWRRDIAAEFLFLCLGPFTPVNMGSFPAFHKGQFNDRPFIASGPEKHGHGAPATSGACVPTRRPQSSASFSTFPVQANFDADASVDGGYSYEPRAPRMAYTTSIIFQPG